ncbi:MAG: DUF2911 domain-containing protein [Candidatus Eiseniibacteriota bacterium]
MIPRSLPHALATALTVTCLVTSGARAEFVPPRPSPGASVSQTIGVTKFTLDYNRPGVKGRAIWGALVPYDSTWRTGANEPTSLTIGDTIQVAGRTLPAGKYSILTIPRRGAWTVIFSGQKDLQGSTNYDPKQDVLRAEAAPDTTQPHEEWMWLGFEDLTQNSGSLVLRWQRLRLAVPITAETNAIVLANARREIGLSDRDVWRNPLRAATWCFDNSVALAEGKAWLEKSIAAQPNHANLSLRARWLAKDGKKAEAIAAAKQAIAAGKAAKPVVDTAATEKLMAEWVAKK